jgi:hypothetical protein
MLSIEEYISKLPDNEKKLLIKLRKIVLETLPGVKEKFSYGVPYYFGNTRICFIWPASSPCSRLEKGVVLGFCKGYLLSNEQGILEQGGRTQVYTITYTSEKQIRQKVLKEILAEAMMLDERSVMAGHLKKMR